jgi:hypothetical protein
MASIETALYKILADDATVGAICGNRIYPKWIPQGTAFPAVTYNQLAGERLQVTAGPVGMVDSSFEFTCWASSYLVTRQLADAVRQALDGFASVSDTINIQSIQLEDESDVPSEVAGVDVLKRFAKILSFVVWFDETP